jgi:hypothetical protein
VIIPVGYAQANIRFVGDAAPNGSEITIGLDLGDFAAGSPSEAADEVADAWSPTVHTVLSHELVLSEVYVKFGPNDVGASGSTARAVDGGSEATSVPPNTCILVHKRTTIGGRRGRGRMYVPGCPEPQMGPHGLLTGTYLGQVQVELDDFYTALTTAGLTPVVLHAAGVSATPAPSEITQFVAQGLGATQRDRMRP